MGKVKKASAINKENILQTYNRLIDNAGSNNSYLKFLQNKGLKTGEGVLIHPTVIFRYPNLVEIGDRSAINEYVVVTTKMILGIHVEINQFCSIIGGRNAHFIMEDFSVLAAGCRIICATDDYAGGTGLFGPVLPKNIHSKIFSKTITIKKHAGLGSNVVVMPGITIGEGAVVGAGAVILKDLEPWTVNVGIPAKPIKTRPKNTILKYEKKIRRKYK